MIKVYEVCEYNYPFTSTEPVLNRQLGSIARMNFSNYCHRVEQVYLSCNHNKSQQSRRSWSRLNSRMWEAEKVNIFHILA